MSNQYAPVTQAELDSCAAAIAAAGLTLETIGRVRLGRLLNCTANHANELLRKLRGREGPTPITSVRGSPPMPHKLSELIGKLEGQGYEIPEWTRPSRGANSHHVVPVVLASDWHLDEVVKPEQVNGLNAYNRQMAELRLRRYFENTIKVTRDYLKGFDYPGIVMASCGDILSGNINEELRNTNADVIMSSMFHWLPLVAAGLKLWAAEFGKVLVTWVVGNHGRMSLKPIYKNRVRENFDWLFARILQRDLASDKRISWAVSDSSRAFFTVCNTRFSMTHGDEARGGSGIAGLLSPLMIADARARKNHSYDYWIVGHWHQRANFKRIRANGSLVGFSEFAAGCNFEAEPPQQSLFVVDPKHGPICDWPIFVSSDTEPWRVAATGEPMMVVKAA